MKKPIIVIVAIILLVIALVAVGQFYIGNVGNRAGNDQPAVDSEDRRSFSDLSQLSATATPVIEKASIVIDFGNGKKLQGQVAAKNVQEALESLAKENKLTVSTKQYKYGSMVEKIGDTGGSSSYAWMYSVNGKAGQIAAERYQVKPNDQIEWKYQKLGQ